MEARLVEGAAERPARVQGSVRSIPAIGLGSERTARDRSMHVLRACGATKSAIKGAKSKVHASSVDWTVSVRVDRMVNVVVSFLGFQAIDARLDVPMQYI
ncbi:hypothetical protein NL676_037252 [Syzygium grande]|nr:hypothetical protein NL676_037252 [Syzygium grande]